MKLANLTLAAALAVVPATAIFAQTATPAPAKPVNRQTIAERKTDQQGRVAQGVKSGQLTARETGRLEHQEAGINKEERGMRAQDNGHLTAGDKTLLTRQQNQESKRIYADKHNARKQ